jgi:uncharacterized protein
LLLPFALCLLTCAPAASAQQPIPVLTDTVNDFAMVVDENSRRRIDEVVRALQQASGDVVVVATIRTVEPWGDIREYAVEMFENAGRGIGERGRDNGLLVLLAVDDREVWVEVGYDLEQFITDGFAGETSRQFMIPQFRNGAYGAGLLAGVQRIAGRIAQGRNVTLEGVDVPRSRPVTGPGSGGTTLVALFVLFLLLNAVAGRLRGTRSRRRRRWHSGVGPFGGGFGVPGGFGGGFGRGGFGGGFGGGGFGGGFGGFGGGRSGGGGGGGSW